MGGRIPMLVCRASLLAISSVSLTAYAGCTKPAELAWVETTPGGYVAAPVHLASAPGIDAGRSVAIAPASTPDPPASRRALPPEPPAPPHTMRCTKETICRDEEDTPPPSAFPAPFDRCLDTYGASPRVASFSVIETRAARQKGAKACCYVRFNDCALSEIRSQSRPASIIAA